MWALALCRALSAPHPGVLDQLPVILDAVTTVLMDARAVVRVCKCPFLSDVRVRVRLRL